MAKDRRNQRARSQDRLVVGSPEENENNFGLSKSALNERYFEEKSGNKSRSLDNLLDNQVRLE